MHPALTSLLKLLDLTQLEDDVFEGEISSLGGGRVFGGQVLGQALVASQRCSRGWPAHSLHAYFLNRGDPNHSIRYEVARLRSSRAFDAFEITASQQGELIFKMMASHQQPEPGPEHQIPMDDVGKPEGETFEEALLRVMTPRGDELGKLDFELPLEIRGVGGLAMFSREVRPPNARVWLRFRGEVPDDPILAQALFAYASDYAIMAPALHPHPFSALDMMTASLDHALWFHRPLQLNQWFLFELDSPVGHGARGVGRGLLYDSSGLLVASCTQEAMMRPLTKPKFSSAR